jgi:hypothetical protein
LVEQLVVGHLLHRSIEPVSCVIDEDIEARDGLDYFAHAMIVPDVELS